MGAKPRLKRDLSEPCASAPTWTSNPKGLDHETTSDMKSMWRYLRIRGPEIGSTSAE